MTRSFARQSSNKSRRHVGIPIPSFSDNIIVEPAEAGKPDSPVAPLLPVETLVLAEGTIRTFLVARKRTFVNIQTEWIPLVQTLPASIQQQIPNFAETLLVQLLSLPSIPLQSFYNLVDHKLTLGTYSGGDRVLELRRLAQLPVAIEKRHQVEARVRKQLTKKKNQSNGTSAQLLTTVKQGISKKRSVQEILNHLPSKENETNPSNATTTTLEERVAARAHAKKERTKEALSDMYQSKQDFLLKVADALWSHSRHVLLRQSKLRSTTLQNQSQQHGLQKREQHHPPQPCVMLMRDIVQLVSHLGTRTQIVSSVKELQQRLPQWIVFSDPMVQKTTTVWINEIPNYQEVRHALQSPHSEPSIQSATKAATNTDPVVASTMSLLKRKAPPPTARNLTSILNKVQKTADSLATSRPSTLRKATGTTIVSTSMNSGAAAASGNSIISNHIQKNPTHNTSSATTGLGRKQQARRITTTTTTPKIVDDNEEPMRKKFKQQLRINHHLILTDADHDGGEIIVPTGESPRGLKRLFHQMNSGQRI